MKILLLILIGICIPITSYSYDLEEVVAVNIVIIADGFQTIKIAKNPLYIEHNPGLGNYPSTGRVVGYISAGLLAYNVLVVVLPEKYEKVLTKVVGSLELHTVLHNKEIGVDGVRETRTTGDLGDNFVISIGFDF